MGTLCGLEGIGALGEVPLLADCTRLSLVISDSNSDEDPDMEDIRSIMTVLGDSLARWRSLRYLFLGCTYPDHYGSLPMRKGKPLDCKTYFEDAESVSLDWAEELRQEAIDFHGLESHGDACAMELWKELHEYEEMWVGRLAWACTTLEVIEWSMQERGFDADGLSLGRCPHPPLWRWKVHREPDGAARLVSGQLTWNGHPNHPPPVG
ncbi:hypothetical protein DFH09DRAFT_1269909 [Mycena vulgaris]|nr:hypothetical protein DFH09DRAFT_1269909 [Mycena vulgaris]